MHCNNFPASAAFMPLHVHANVYVQVTVTHIPNSKRQYKVRAVENMPIQLSTGHLSFGMYGIVLRRTVCAVGS